MRSDGWSPDDLFFLEAAYIGGMTKESAARMLRKPICEVDAKAQELGFTESPPTAPRDNEAKAKTPAEQDPPGFLF